MNQVRTVLIVEDDLPFADFLRAAIESLGHRSVIVSSGAEAVDAYDQHRPDLVFLDLLLPKRDGFKICDDIRRHAAGATVPVIMMTGIYRKAVYEREGLEKSKANEYLLKPFGVREVWRVLERHLGAGVTRLPEPAGSPAATGTSLGDIPLACQLASHLAGGSNGVLFVRDAEATFVIYVREGAPIFARSSDPADRLDRVLLKTGRLTAAELDSALKASGESRGRMRLGETLVERGHVTREQLETALQLQLRLILNRAFQAESGQCLFVVGEHPTEEDVLLTANPREILLRGARATSLPAVEASLPEGGAILTRPLGWESLLAGLNLRDDEARLLQLADGSTTVERFLATAAVAGFDGPRILLGLTCAGLVTSSPGATCADAEPATTAWDASEWSGRPFGASIADLHRRRATGRLTIVGPAGETKKIDFRRGLVTWVESDAAADRLGAMIERMELLPAETLAGLLAEVGDDPRDAALGRLLIDRGALGPSELYWAAVYQAHGAVHSLLERPAAGMEWLPGHEGSPVTLPDVPTMELAWNGMRSLDDATVRELLPEPGTWLEGTAAPADGLPLSASEFAALARIQSGLAVDELLADADEDARRTALGLLWMGLACTRLHDTVESAPRASSTAPDIDDDAACVPLDDTGFDMKAFMAPDEPQPEETAERPAPRVVQAAAGAVATTARGGFLDMLHDEAFLDDEEGPSGADSELLESRASDELPASLPRPRSPMPASRQDASELGDSLTNLAKRLKELRPVLRTLRGGLDGTDKRVLVDRERMAELFDGLLEAIATTSEIEDLLDRWQSDQAAARHDALEPAGVTRS